MIDQSQLKYSKTHEWISLDGDLATIGDRVAGLLAAERILPEMGEAVDPARSR